MVRRSGRAVVRADVRVVVVVAVATAVVAMATAMATISTMTTINRLKIRKKGVAEQSVAFLFD